MANPVVHFEIIGKDTKALQDFYTKLFGWNIDANNSMNYGLARTKTNDRGIDGGISAGDPSQPDQSYVTIYAEVDDPDAYLKKVENLGGKIIVPTTEIPNMVTFAMFADPEGHMVGLVKAESM